MLYNWIYEVRRICKSGTTQANHAVNLVVVNRVIKADRFPTLGAIYTSTTKENGMAFSMITMTCLVVEIVR